VLSSGRAVHANTELHIALLLWRGETEAELGFKEELQALGYTVRYTVKNAEQDQQRLGQVLRHDIVPQLQTFDYIYTFGTTVSQIAKAVIQNKVPQIFNVVTDPVGAGIIRDLQASGENISGTTSDIPLAMQVDAASKILPLRRLGFLYNPREKNAMLVRQQLLEIATHAHIEVLELRSPPADDMLRKQLQHLVEKSIVVDAVYLPADSYMVSQAALIGTQLRAAKLPSIGSVKTFVEHGALVGVVADYASLGRATARIVHRHRQGEELARIPVQTVQAPVLVINTTASKLLNLTIPDAVLKEALIVEEK
jgi:putative ABC transport system substrate-binding protein